MLLLAFDYMPFNMDEMIHEKSLIAAVLGFLIFFIVVIRYMPANIPLGWPFIQNALNERRSRIASTQDQVDAALADTQKLHDDYAARLRTIETESRQRIDAALQEAETAREQIIADAQQNAEAIKRRAEQDIAQEQIRQRILLRRQIVQLTLTAAEGSVSDLADDQVQRSLISDFITTAAAGGKRA